MSEAPDNTGLEEALRRIAATKRSNETYLDLKGLRLTEIPKELIELTNLTGLSLEDNQITNIPEKLSELTNLEYLAMDTNQVTAIPEKLSKLTNLRYLYLQRNRITAIPAKLSELISLQELWIHGNRITAIPAELSELTKLQHISLDDNPLPDELLTAAGRGVKSLFRYLNSTSQDTVYPRTVKLVLLGEPKSGKTTLLEALKGNPHPCDPDRRETIGVDFVTIKALHPGDQKSMYLSVWDFAGQHIEHATHQFFLTENAIYLILWNARQGAEAGKRDLWYWLELLKLRVRKPQFLLVATHIEHTPPDVNLSEIERSYAGCEGQYPVDLATLKGFPDLQQKILELAGNTPALRAEWPAAWLALRDEVRAIREQQPHVTPSDFRRLMKKHKVTDRLKQQDVTNQLHDLGEILYFQERDELSSLVILNPEWVTTQIALVVRSDAVRTHNGILRNGDLNALWREANLEPSVRQHLIRLMDWFDLTYSTGQRKEIGIVVEALPYSTPEILRDLELSPDQPQMEMIFRFPSLQRRLPPGIPTWGIARAHRFSKQKPWRDAAAFRDEETKSEALILASDAKKEIRLRVAADFPPFFFGRMEAILRDTFKRYPGLEPERRIPCTCRPNCPTSYLYERVWERFRDGKDLYCEGSGKDIDSKELMTGYTRPSSEEGRLAFESEVRRRFTEHLRGQRERMEKTCPSVFTLLPSHDFKQLDTWIDAATKDEELELTLYCEHESGWHPTSQSLYRFRADQQWFKEIKGHWNKLASITKLVAPLAKAAGLPVLEKLPEAPLSGNLSAALGEKETPESIDLETRHLLEKLIGYLDSQRSLTAPRNGGLNPYQIDDGRLLWMCPDHIKAYKPRA